MTEWEREQQNRERHYQRSREQMIPAGILLVGFGLFLLLWTVLLEGCPRTIPPRTEDGCAGHPNCGICASEAVCVWCPDEGEAGRCLGASDTSCDPSRVVTIPERCEGALPPGEEFER